MVGLYLLLKLTHVDINVSPYRDDGAETCTLVGLYSLLKLTHLDINVSPYRDDGAETCTLVGLYLLLKLTHVDINVSPYRDDGAETCTLVGLYLLLKLTHLDINVSPYRDDGLATCSLPPKQAESIKQEISKIFQHNGLKITIQANKKSYDFLDVTLDLRDNLYKPYRKQNNNLSYINEHSNHPPVILRNLPTGISNRISTNSKSENVFRQACPAYTEALR